MTSITGAERLADGDYTVSHRAPPPVPLSGIAYPPDSSVALDRDRNSVKSEGRRRGSFNFLRRGSSTGVAASNPSHPPSDPAPPLPTAAVTRITQAHVQAAADRSSGRQQQQPPQQQQQQQQHHIRNFSLVTGSTPRTSTADAKPGMLRKHSKTRALQEQERLAREREAAAAAARPPPSLPSHAPLPVISSFGGENYRSDRAATYHHPRDTAPYHYDQPAAAAATAAYYPRPGHATMPAAGYNSSSPPTYAVRPGNAFANTEHAASSSPNAPQAQSSGNGEYVLDASERGESMTNRGRYSYASSAAPNNINSPRRVRRRKDPTPFNVLIIGAKGSGKTSFISFLRHSLALPSHKQPLAADMQSESPPASSKSFTSHYLETEMDGERVGVTLWDSAGLEKNIADLQLREMAAFVESKFEETFLEEQKVMRSPGMKDTHIHCVILVLDPARLHSTANVTSDHKNGGTAVAKANALDNDLDLQPIRALWGKTTVIPVIAKADTLTVGHMSFLKRAVWESLKGAKLNPLEALELDDDAEDDDDDAVIDEEAEDNSTESVSNNLVDRADGSDDEVPPPKAKRNGHLRQSSLAGPITGTNDEDTPYIPMSILSPDLYDLPPYAPKSKSSPNDRVGRRFPWGFADPYDPLHCDFTRLRDSVFGEWRGDLRDLARTKWYENWRTSRLKNLPGFKQRVKGGVTPVAAVPREGRTTSPLTARHVASMDPAAASMPRTVSTGAAAASNRVGSAAIAPPGERSTGKAERVAGVNEAERQAAPGGTYRSIDTYQ